MIYRCVPHHRVRYIIGATGEGHRWLRRAPNQPLSFIEYIFIDCDEDVRTWLLSNSGLDDPLDLLLYCYRDRHDKRNDTAELRSLPYLGQDAIRHWARDPAARIGQSDFRALEPNARPTGGQANDGEEQPGDDTPNISSSESAHESEDDGEEAQMDDRFNIWPSEDISGILPSRVGGTRRIACKPYPPCCQIVQHAESTTAIGLASSPCSSRQGAQLRRSFR